MSGTLESGITLANAAMPPGMSLATLVPPSRYVSASAIAMRSINESLSAEYGARSLAKFVESHKPFHWYVEFNQIIQNGGFDAIVGNPPYVEYGQIRDQYQIRGFVTGDCGNLFAYASERKFHLWLLSVDESA